MIANARSVLLPPVAMAATAAFALAAPVRAQTPPTTAAAVIPAAPAPPARLSFADEVAGRRALFSARNAYRTAPSIHFKADLRTLTQTGAGKPTLVTASESVAAAPANLRLNMTYETQGAKMRQVRRAVANGESIIATRFEQGARAASAPPVREVMRVPFVGDVRTLAAGLSLLKVAPSSRGGILLLDPAWNVRGTVWRERSANGVETVNELDADASNGRTRTRRIRRYQIDTRTRLLRTFEEWDTTTDERGGNAAAARSRITYRREQYGVSASGKALPATLFAQAVPAGYRDVAIPSGSDVEPTGPLEIDAKSAALLARWEQAWNRFTSLNARATLTTDAVGKTFASRTVPDEWRDQQWEYAVQMRRPGRLYLTLNPVASPEVGGRGAAAATPDAGRGRRGGSPVSAQTVVADGQAVLVTGARNGRERAVPIGPDPSLLGVRARQAGYNDASETLGWLLYGPRSVYENADTVSYKGQASADGVSVDVIEITENVRVAQGGRRRRGAGDIESTLVTTLYLAADGLPRRTERYRTVRVEGGMLRDDPPDTVFVARYRDVVTDAPPAPETFRLPSGAGRTARGGN